MEPDRRNRISHLYHAALERAPEERSAFVREACAGDEALQQEVESLLRYESASSRFLETPAAAVVAAVPDSAQMVHRQIGPYTIVAPLGAGGMGEVYRARDNKLGRDVAIKILPSHFTADPERRTRFAREARLLATLNHPHIGAIYGLEESGGLTALVLELVEGPTLADRLERGPLPISETLAIARQIADALDEAHEKGIIHRDLKPANIVLQGAAGPVACDVRAKVLDFGLAKTLLAPSANPTLHPTGTAEGRILGTPAYMSPEQARGLPVDKRTDIWAFGCVLYEMLSGRRPFEGATITDTFARILEHEPDWSALPGETPVPIRRLIERCQRKDPRKRLRDIADALIEIDDGGKAVDVIPPAGAALAPRRTREWLAWVVAATLAVGSGGMALLNRRAAQPAPTEPVEFQIDPPAGSEFFGTSPEFAIAPDGRHVAFIATSKAGMSLWVRPLATLELRELPGTEDARNPFWSPDGQSIGYFAGSMLRTVRVTGGSPVDVCQAPLVGSGALSGTWNTNGVILFGPLGGSLYKAAARGGPPTPVTTLAKDETAHRWPWFLPDGQHFLYLALRGERGEVRVGSLDSSDVVALGAFDSHVVFSTGHLFFVRGGNLMAQPFDAASLQTTGDPLPLGAQAGIDPPWQRGMFSVSSTGRLVYRPTARATSQLTWLDRSGRPVGTVGDPAVHFNLDLSPDGLRVALSKLTQRPAADAEFDIWVIDLTTERSIRVTDGPGWQFDPAWSPDGTQIVFNSNRLGGWSLFTRASDGSGADAPILKWSPGVRPSGADWSRTNLIVYTNNARPSSETARDQLDLWTVRMSGDRKPTVFLNTKHMEIGGVFSPDGKWIAYTSNETGRRELYVRPFPGKEPAAPISRDGGSDARWRGDGRELFFLSPDGGMMAARIETTNGLAASAPQLLFTTKLRRSNNRPYAVAADGQRFLIPIAAAQPLRVVLDWRAMLAR
jgi:Tol biopolymer transport system component